MKGLIYARQSKKEEKENSYSIPAQIKESTDYANAHKIELPYPPIVERGKSGQRIQREGIIQSFNLISKDPELSYFLVTDVDRIGRHEVDPLFFMWLLNYKHVTIIANGREYNITKDPVDVIISAADCYKGYKEGRDIGIRTQRCKRLRFSDGLWVRGVPPEGYYEEIKFFDNGRSRKKWLHKKDADVPFIKALFIACKGKATLNDVIKKQGSTYESIYGKKLTPSILKRILTDPVYKGRPNYGYDSYYNPELQIVDDDLFNDIQNKFTKRKKNHSSKDEKENIFDILTKNFGLGFAARTIAEYIPHCPNCRNHMIIHDGSITHGVYVTRWVCESCKTSITRPTGAQINSYKHLNLLSCPYCRETEYFECFKVENTEYYHYKCLVCGNSFRCAANPDRFLRRLGKKEPEKNPPIKEIVHAKKVIHTTIDSFN